MLIFWISITKSFFFLKLLSSSLSMAASSSSSPSSSRIWEYDVFPSFSGEDVRVTFLSHFLKELDQKLIIAFKDKEIERSQSLDPELKQAIKDSRIAVVVFSKNYASSSWCLNELREIVKCKEEFGQIVIPVFYGLDPSHVRKKTGEFGKIFEETCHNKTEEVIIRWREALTDVANILGYHSTKWGNEATMIEAIANDVLDKLILTPSKDFENFVGIEDHIAQISVLLQWESEEVRMVGMWGSSGIGKTTIARALFNRLSWHFQGSIFIDRGFISKSKETYSRANADDHNMKLHLQGNFLSEILGKKDIKIDHLGALGEKLKHQKVLIIIDDVDDRVVLDVLVGKTQWFGSGSRIIVVTNDKHLLLAHGIYDIYEVVLPSEECALEMLCQSAFKQNSPPEGFEKLAVEVVRHAGSLPLGLNVLGSSLRGRDKEYWVDMLPMLQNGLDGEIEKTLRVSYDRLRSEDDKAIFRHIACLFNGVEVIDIKLLLADSNLGVNIALKNLADKSLIHVRWGHVEMHRLLQEMGRKLVRTQSIDKPGKREFLVESEDICDVLTENTGTKKVIGISLNMCEIDELHVHESAFKGMCNLRFLDIFSKKRTLLAKPGIVYLPESFDYLPHTLRFLCWPSYPMRCMPSNFLPKNLIKIEMPNSKLEKLWDGVASLTCLKEMNLSGCSYLKEVPDLSMALNLEKLILELCLSLVELSSSIRNLNKLEDLDMSGCTNLATLPTGLNLKSLYSLNLRGCSRLKSFPEISTKISQLFLSKTAIEEFPSNFHFHNLLEYSMESLKNVKLWVGVEPLTPLMTMFSPSLTMMFLSDIPNLVELPSSFQNLQKLKTLSIIRCTNLETLPRINLQCLLRLNLDGCSRLRSFPDISRNVLILSLNKTAIEEIPRWINKFYRLKSLFMKSCSNLKYVSISTLKHLEVVDFSNCRGLAGARWNGYPNRLAMEENNIKVELAVLEEASCSLPNNFVPKVMFKLINCFDLNLEALLQQQSVFEQLILSCEEVPSYFTHKTTGSSSSSLTIHLLQSSLCEPFFRLRACAIAVFEPTPNRFDDQAYITVSCQFKDHEGNYFSSPCTKEKVLPMGYKEGTRMFIFDCCFSLNEENAPLAKPNYDHVDIEFHFCSDVSKLKEWGVRLLEDCSTVGNRFGSPTTLPNEDNMVNDECHYTENGGKCEENDLEPE